MKFYSTIRLEVRRAEQIKNGTDVIGNRTRIKVVKNKVAPPFKKAEVDIMYGHGISQTGELLDMAVEKDIVDKSGSWYSYGEDRIGQGRENAKQYLADHPDMMAEVNQRVRAAYGVADEDAEDSTNDKAKTSKATKGKAKDEAKPTTEDGKKPKSTVKTDTTPGTPGHTGATVIQPNHHK